jgi:NAD(P)-dependent dehydrogenase (short-subunit alcohol dehydrogenase family)
LDTLKRLEPDRAGALRYNRIDIRNSEQLDAVISEIAAKHNRIDGLIAAAGVQQIKPAADYTAAEVTQMMDINFTGVFMTASAVARAMMRLREAGNKDGGSIVLVGSMSGLVANKGLISPVYNSSKAAVIQLGRNLAMEWGKYGIRVNTLCPGHIVTPMVEANFAEVPGLRAEWERENMLGRLAQPTEFQGAGLFLLSKSSSFMTGSNLVIDGGHTAW